MKQERCRVTAQGRPCGRVAVAAMQVPGTGRVPMCATHHAAIDGQIKQQIHEWAQQLARGASVDDLKLSSK